MSENGHKLDFDLTGPATCAESGDKYHFQNGIVEKIEMHDKQN